MTAGTDFDRSFEIVVGHEGGYSTNPDDPGNWTGGAVGAGQLNGTKYGISAAAYPTTDIANLTLPKAKSIYFLDYWMPTECATMPGRLALIMFDAAVNNGVWQAIQFLQAALGVDMDGVIGPETRAALASATAFDPMGTVVMSETHAQRIDFMGNLSTWPTFGLGWSRRLAQLPIDALNTWPS
jgi:lysozyme family protein